MARSTISKTKTNAVPKTTRWTPEDLERIEEVRVLFDLGTFTDSVRTCVLLASKSARIAERRKLSKRKKTKTAK
jgi:hypothetical protein